MSLSSPPHVLPPLSLHSPPTLSAVVSTMPIPSSTAANGATTITTSSSSAAVNTAHLGDMITAVLANHDSLREENAQLYRQLDDALRRAKNAENAMAVSRSPNSTALANAQAQLDNEQAAHAETRAHLRAIQEAWAELERYASILDVRAADARSVFSTILRDPVAASQRLPPLRPPSPFVPPRRATATSAATTAIAPTPNSIAPTRTLQALPTMPTLPPVPSSLAPRRHRADSLEGRPAKRARPDVAHHPPEQIACPPPYYSAPAPERYHPSYAVYPQRQLARGRSPARRTPPVHVSTNGTAPDTTAVSNSNANVTTSPSRSRSRSRSMSVDDLLLEATESQPSAPPFQHVFTQPVTGPPRKRLEKSGTMIEPYNAASNARMSNTAAAAGLPAGGFPAQNDKGQRICRQCGLPGRYKDGKCVEKWGPGPEGPGTVCDRCRKKMKRVERRGTLDPHALSNQGSQHAPAPPSPPSLPPLTATHTAPARTQLAHPPIAALRSPPSPSRSPSLSPPRSTGYPPAGGRRYTPPARAPYSPNPKQYKRSPSDRDADGETEDPRDGDDDADVDDDLLEAIDAAEESRSNGHGPHMHTMNGVKREILDVLV